VLKENSRFEDGRTRGRRPWRCFTEFHDEVGRGVDLSGIVAQGVVWQFRASDGDCLAVAPSDFSHRCVNSTP
jgi:hypothetical protein